MVDCAPSLVDELTAVKKVAQSEHETSQGAFLVTIVRISMTTMRHANTLYRVEYCRPLRPHERTRFVVQAHELDHAAFVGTYCVGASERVQHVDVLEVKQQPAYVIVIRCVD